MLHISHVPEATVVVGCGFVLMGRSKGSSWDVTRILGGVTFEVIGGNVTFEMDVTFGLGSSSVTFDVTFESECFSALIRLFSVIRDMPHLVAMSLIVPVSISPVAGSV